MSKFFYISGVAFWVLVISIVAVFVILFLVYLLNSYVGPTITNLWFYFFPFKKWKGQYSTIWYENFARRSGIRQYWKSWKYLKRLVYIRLLKESKKEIHEKLKRS